MSHNDYDYTFKFILIGDTCTGKTTIANSYIRLEKNIIINNPTLGIDFATRIISLANGKRIKLICLNKREIKMAKRRRKAKKKKAKKAKRRRRRRR